VRGLCAVLEFVEKTRQNLTLVVEEDLLQAARKIAVERGRSVKQLVRDYPEDLVEAGDRTWTRSHLHDR
jgi:predicted GIY-YIG superfamily endonuclease